MSLDLSDADRKALAADVAAELDTGRYGDRFVLSRRQLLTIAGGAGGVAALTALGVDPAAAQSAAGQVGTESSPENVFAYNLDVQGALQRDLDAGGQAISNVGSLSTEEAIIGSRKIVSLDDNGDVTDSGSSVSISLANSYDYIRVRILSLNTISGGTTPVDITFQINGNTNSDYKTFRVSGASISDSWVIGEAAEFGLGRLCGEFQIFSTNNRFSLDQGVVSERASDPTIAATLEDTSAQIESLTFASTNGVDLDVEVFGGTY